jgi:hypothetical protein
MRHICARPEDQSAKELFHCKSRTC